MGEEGVRHVMKSLLADFDILMGVGGFNSVKDFDRSILGTSSSVKKGTAAADHLLESCPRSYTYIPDKVL